MCTPGSTRPIARNSFFKAAGWWVVFGDGGRIGVRPDSTWTVPEPELAVLANASAEVVGYACGNDMSSRSIEGENPLYLPQAKVYRDSCSLGPAIALAWYVDDLDRAIHLHISRNGVSLYDGEFKHRTSGTRPREVGAGAPLLPTNCHTGHGCSPGHRSSHRTPIRRQTATSSKSPSMR